MRNLKKMIQIIHLQKRNRFADLLENTLMITKGERLGGEIKWEPGVDVYTLSVSHSVVSDSVRPHGLWPARLLCPWDPPGKNTGVGCHFLLQGIFPPQDQTRVSLIAGGFFTA